MEGGQEETGKRDARSNRGENAEFSAGNEQKTFWWRVPESRAVQKSGDWYFLLWTGAVAGGVVSVLLGNILFALLLVLAAFTLSIYASKRPKEIEITVSKRGVIADTLFLPYSSLSAFYIVTNEAGESHLILEPSKPLGMRHAFPVGPAVDIDNLRDFLLKRLKEEELDIPFSDKIADSIGF